MIRAPKKEARSLFSFRTPVGLLARAKAKAKRDGRSLGGVIIWLLSVYVGDDKHTRLTLLNQSQRRD